MGIVWIRDSFAFFQVNPGLNARVLKSTIDDAKEEDMTKMPGLMRNAVIHSFISINESRVILFLFPGAATLSEMAQSNDSLHR
jgi:hypothetical protein